MAKRQIELTSERPMTKGVTDHAPRVIRVRKEIWRGGSRYVMNHWLPVPDWMRHLDGVTIRDLVLAALVLLGVGYGLARRLLLAEK